MNRSSIERRGPTRRWVVACGTIAGGAALLAGCAQVGGGGEERKTKAKAPVTLRVHTRPAADLDGYFTKRKPDFQAMLPHVTLEIEPVGTGPVDYTTKMLVIGSAGELGDAAWGTSRAGYTKQLASKGIFQALEPLAKTDKFALTEYYTNALGEATWEGKLMSLPHITEPGQIGLMWNRSLWKTTALREPSLAWTYDNLREAATELSKGPTDQRDQFGFAGSFGFLGFLPVLRAFGGDLLSADGTRCVFDTPQALAAVQWQHDMIRRSVAVPPPGGAPPGGFNGGRIAMQPHWPTAIKGVPIQLAGAFEVASSLLPKGPTGERGTMLNSHTMGVTRTTKHVEEAWAWVKWSCGRDFAVHRIVSGSGGPVGRPDVWRNEQVLREIPEWKDWADLMDKARPNHIPANLRGQEIEETMDRNLAAVWRGQIGPVDGIKQTVTEIQQVLNQPRI